MSIIAGIVVYFPDATHLDRLVRTLAAEVRTIVIYANSPVDPEMEERLRTAAGRTLLEVVRPGENGGLGAAYNALADRALAERQDYFFLLDQDSLPDTQTVSSLRALFGLLDGAGERAALVGPRPVDADRRPFKVSAGPPRTDLGFGARRSAFVISSGSLVRTEAAKAIGAFRADYFIDAIDIEWCMRANALGYSTWLADGIAMAHSLGQGVIRLPFGIRMVRQPPRRLYTFLRNQLDMLRLPHVPGAYKRKWLMILPLRIIVYVCHDRFRLATCLAIWRGLSDGARGRLGPPSGRFD